MLRSTARTTAVSVGLAGLAALALAAPALAGAGAHVAGDLTRYPATQPLADAPEGASARVHSLQTGDGRTIVHLHVRGLRPHTEYGAHAHTNPCGATGAAAGPHYQFVLDPAAGPGAPSVDPAYANPQNEIWLDLTTNAAGNGHARAVLDWEIPATRRPGSVIMHERHTSTAAGVAGAAGQRIACLTVAF